MPLESTKAFSRFQEAGQAMLAFDQSMLDSAPRAMSAERGRFATYNSRVHRGRMHIAWVICTDVARRRVCADCYISSAVNAVHLEWRGDYLYPAEYEYEWLSDWSTSGGTLECGEKRVPYDQACATQGRIGGRIEVWSAEMRQHWNARARGTQPGSHDPTARA